MLSKKEVPASINSIVEFGLLESISKFDVWYFDKNPVCFTIS